MATGTTLWVPGKMCLRPTAMSSLQPRRMNTFRFEEFQQVHEGCLDSEVVTEPTRGRVALAGTDASLGPSHSPHLTCGQMFGQGLQGFCCTECSAKPSDCDTSLLHPRKSQALKSYDRPASLRLPSRSWCPCASSVKIAACSSPLGLQLCAANFLKVARSRVRSAS